MKSCIHRPGVFDEIAEASPWLGSSYSVRQQTKVSRVPPNLHNIASLDQSTVVIFMSTFIAKFYLCCTSAYCILVKLIIPVFKANLRKLSKEKSTSPLRVCTTCPSPLQRWNPLGTPASGSSNFQLWFRQHSEQEMVKKCKISVFAAVVLSNGMEMWSEKVARQQITQLLSPTEKFKTACHDTFLHQPLLHLTILINSNSNIAPPDN